MSNWIHFYLWLIVFFSVIFSCQSKNFCFLLTFAFPFSSHPITMHLFLHVSLLVLQCSNIYVLQYVCKLVGFCIRPALYATALELATFGLISYLILLLHKPVNGLAPMASVAARTWSMLTPATSAIVILWELVQLHDNIVWWDHAPCSSVTKRPCAHSPESQQNNSNRSLSFRFLSSIPPSCNICPTVLPSFLPAQIPDVFPQPLT